MLRVGTFFICHFLSDSIAPSDGITLELPLVRIIPAGFFILILLLVILNLIQDLNILDAEMNSA